MADYASNTFQYNGTKYTIVVQLYTFIDGERKKSCALDILALTKLEYVNQLNSLLMTGTIFYTDKYGVVDKFIEEQYTYCDIFLYENEEQFDNGISISKLSETNKFQHTFLVDGIEILDRQKSIVNYKINLVSKNWFNCIGNIVFSNYGGSSQPVFQILKQCIAAAKLSPNESFDKVHSAVSLLYITNGNDNLFSVFGYLMRRMYYLESRDDSLKFLLYNQLNDVYQLLDMKDSNTSTGRQAMLVSFFKTSSEHMVQQDPVNFGVVTKLPKTGFLPSLFYQDMHTFEYDSNTFGNTPFEDQQNIAYFTNKFDAGVKSKPKAEVMPFLDGVEFKHRASTWRNETDFYHDYAQALFDTNALVVNSVADIQRMPGTIITIAVDRSTKDLDHEDPDSLQTLKNRYKTFEGPWIASKVRNIIEPNGGSGGNGQFRQNVVLIRNFLNEIEEEQMEAAGGNK